MKCIEAIRVRAHALYLPRTRLLTTGLILGLSGLILGLMLWRSLPILFTYHWQLQVLPLFVAFVIYLCDLLLVVLGWSLIMRQFTQRLDFWKHFRIYSITFFAKRIPGAPWHLVGRVALYKQLGINSSVASVAVGLETILIIVSGIISSTLIGFSFPESVQRYLLWMSIVLVIGLILIHPFVARKILGLLGYAPILAGIRYRHMLLLLGLYLLVWVVGGCMLYMMILALYPLSCMWLPEVIGAWGLSGVVTSLVFLIPTGFGIKEATLSLLLALFVPVEIAVVTAILMRLYITALELLLAIVALRL